MMPRRALATLFLASLLACTGRDGAAGPAGKDGTPGSPGQNGAPGTSSGTVQGTVTASDGSRLSGATVAFAPGTTVATTGASGSYSVTLPIGVYQATARLDGFDVKSVSGISVLAGLPTTQDFSLAPASEVRADAGTDRWQAGFGVDVQLDASSSTGPASAALRFGWVQVSGPPVNLAGADTARPTFTTLSLEEAASQNLLLLPEAFTAMGFTFEEVGRFSYEFEVTVSAGPASDARRVVVQSIAPRPPVSAVGVGHTTLLAAPTQATYDWTCARLDAGGAEVPCQAVELAGTTLRTPTFRAAAEGVYRVREGGQAAPLVLTAATYVGMEPALNGNPPSGACVSCHSAKSAGWNATSHASFFRRAIDGAVNPLYARACIRCHTTGYNPEAANGGFADLAARAGWQFPTVLQPGNYTDLPAQLKPLATVGCENCHGPASLHVASGGGRTTIGKSIAEATCAQCHSKEPYETQGLQWLFSRHASNVAGPTPRGDDPSLRGSCGDCHSATGFVAWWKAGLDAPPPPVGDLFEQQACAGCHDPHAETLQAGARLPRQLRVYDAVRSVVPGVAVASAGAGAVCVACHNSRQTRSAAPQVAPHPSSQSDVLLARSAETFGLGSYPTGAHAAVPDLCAGCHKAATPPLGQPGHNQMGGHSFAMRVSDLENLVACTGCHAGLERLNRTAFADYDGDGVLEGIQDETEGLLGVLAGALSSQAAALWPVESGGQTPTVLPYRGRIRILKSFALGASDPLCNPVLPDWPERCFAFPAEQIPVTAPGAPTFLGAAWNLFLIDGDHSRGTHNAAFAISVLQRSYQAVTGVPVPGAVLRQ